MSTGSGTSNDRRWLYTYDESAPTSYFSDNNRLMQVDEHQGLSMGQLLSSTWYYYNGFGNITYIVTGAPGGSQQSMMGGGEEETSSQEESMESQESSLAEPGGGGESMMASFECQTGDPYEAVRFEYAANGRTVIYAIHEQWCWTGDSEDDPTEYAVNHVEHYRYDAARQRYLVQVLDPDDPDITDPSKVLSERWSDYDGDNVYGDFMIDEGNPISVRSFEPGLALVTDIDDEGDLYTEYYHGDHLGTTMANSDSDAAPANPAVFTAFGERRLGSVTGPADRYGYVGAFGYQAQEYSGTGEPFTFLHVGARYYDPTGGRFLQRDPIGIRGGFNVYAYMNGPLVAVDPEGTLPDWVLDPLVRLIGPENVLAVTGGQGHVPIADPGIAQDVTLITCEIVSVAALCGIVAKGGRILKNAKGVEITFSKNFRIGWHQFKHAKSGKIMNRPHCHWRIRGPDGNTLPGGGIGRHRPWE